MFGTFQAQLRQQAIKAQLSENPGKLGFVKFLHSQIGVIDLKRDVAINGYKLFAKIGLFFEFAEVLAAFAFYFIDMFI